MNYQQIILNFLKAYKAWVEEGAPKHEIFHKEHGLCTNLNNYARSIYADDEDTVWYISDELVTMFRMDGLSALIPFNHPEKGQPIYSNEVHHENPWRMQWVTNAINKLEGATK
uniref:Uncharacterized protein n=1 Tax=Klebsiella phage vB_Kpn16-P2 TaxID=3230846 RepID=A0AAU8EEN5_9VIRU